MRVFSNFTVKYSNGTLVKIPVLYGDTDRQVANIIKQNSENVLNAAPKISIYISGLSMDRTRLADATFNGKLHVRERGMDVDPITGSNFYTQAQGRNYTVERIMPTPFKLSMKVDIWSVNTDQKLQILEQILVLFNPSLELQTTDNYVDWTSLTVLNVSDIRWTSRTIPVGNDSPIDIATLEVNTPIWLSPPAKVKHLGIITNIITSVFENVNDSWTGLDAFGNDPNSGGTTTLNDILTIEKTTITDYKIQVYSGKAVLLGPYENVLPSGLTIHIPIRQGPPINWIDVFNLYPRKYIAGVSKLFLPSPGGEVIGTITIDEYEPSALLVNWDPDTYPSDTHIDTTGDREAGGQRSTGTFDAIIDPQRVYPGYGMVNVVAGDRFLIIENIGDPINEDGPDGWKNTNGTDFYAKTNDIIEWQTDHWEVIFEAADNADSLIYQTNIYDGNRVQYCWNGVFWAKSFEGEFNKGDWRIEL